VDTKRVISQKTLQFPCGLLRHDIL
jgi:hypothetical protein